MGVSKLAWAAFAWLCNRRDRVNMYRASRDTRPTRDAPSAKRTRRPRGASNVAVSHCFPQNQSTHVPKGSTPTESLWDALRTEDTASTSEATTRATNTQNRPYLAFSLRNANASRSRTLPPSASTASALGFTEASSTSHAERSAWSRNANHIMICGHRGESACVVQAGGGRQVSADAIQIAQGFGPSPKRSPTWDSATTVRGRKGGLKGVD